jgi:O-antigen ligase
MRAVLVLVLVVLIGGDILGVEPGLAPGLSLKNAALYLGFGLLLLQRGVTGRPQVQLGWLQGLFLCMVVYAIGTIVFNAILLDTPRHELLEQAIGIKTQLVDRLIMFLLFFYAARTAADVRVVMTCLLAGIALGSLFTVTNVLGLTSIGPTIYGHENEVEGGRVYGYFGHANETGTLLAALFPAYIAMAEGAAGVKRATWIGALAAVALMLLLTGSRGAMVGLVVGGGAAAFACRRHFTPRRVRAWVLLFLAVLLPLLMVVGRDALATLAGRIAMQASGGVTDASSGRTDLWADGLEAMMDSPWTFITGFGWGGWNAHRFAYIAHNNYLSYWFDLGLPGLLAFVALLAGSMLVARRAISLARDGERGQLIAFLAGIAALSVALVFLNLATPWPYIWAYIALNLRLAVIAMERGRGAERATAGAHGLITPSLPTALRRTRPWA